MKYHPYAGYKSSGSRWLSEIPEHWETSKVRYKFSLGKGLTITKANLEDEGIPCVNYGEVHSKYGFEVDPRKHPLKCVSDSYLSSGKAALLQEGDLVFADTSEDLEGSGNFTQLVCNELVFAGYHTVVTRPFCRKCSRYYAYLFDAPEWRTQIQNAVKGVKVFSITQAILRASDIWLPPLKEQIQIAKFLDYETAKIDALIEKQQQLIELLQEKRQAVISHAVTKGLNPDAPMRDSGVEWLGEVPAHWEVRRIKNLAVLISKGTTPSTIGKEMAEEGVRFIKGENVGKGLLVSKSPEFYISKETDMILERSRLRNDDVLVIIAGATTGQCSVVEADILPANTNQAVSFIRPLMQSHSRFIAIWLSTEFAQRIIWMGAVQAAQPNLSMEDLGNIPIPVPPENELKDILKSVFRKTEQFDQLITQAGEFSILLQERRTALISAAVTGKIDVRDWSIPK